jgi:hypothetical protein
MMSSSTDESSPTESATSEPAQSSVVNWRMRQLQALGFEETEAFQLALSDLDLHLAIRLAGKGCSLELVTRICV